MRNMDRFQALVTALALTLVGAVTSVAEAAEKKPPKPRTLSGVERASVALAGLYLSHGPSAWWRHLAEASDLRQLGEEAGLEELRLRLGPAEGATWRLETPVRSDGKVAVFTIESLSGFDETVRIEMGLEGKFLKIIDLRTRVDSLTGPLERLAPLWPLRQALALGRKEEVEPLLRQVPKEEALLRVASLWEAQFRLEGLDASTSGGILANHRVQFPSPALPLAALLRARLAFLRYDSLQMALAYEEALRQGVDYDGLRLESLEAQALLGYVDEEGYGELADLGSRRAAVYYALARTAVFHKEEHAAEYFRAAWRMEPWERESIFQSPLLARLCLESDVHQWVGLDAVAEPRVSPPEDRKPLRFPPTVQVLVSGNHLSLLYGDDREIEVPGGGILAPEGTVWEEAGAKRRRREEAALEELEQLIEASGSAAALASPRLRRRMETAAVALAGRNRWSDLLRLTQGIADQVEHAGILLGRLRAVALGKMGHEKAAIRLLSHLADSEKDRQSPGLLYQLADLAADYERYELALRLIRKADAMSSLDGGSGRRWQVELDYELAKSHAMLPSEHFILRYPTEYRGSSAAKIAKFLESERQRLKAWIPVTTDRKVNVSLFPGFDFQLVFGNGVLGLFDGKIRVPLNQSPGENVTMANVLTHELVHALIAEYAGEDVPPWFHEGLAQFLETRRPTENSIPELAREKRLLSLPIVDALLDGHGPAALTGQAYEESVWALRFINARFGLKGIRRLLGAFKAGQDTDQALASALSLTPEAFHQALWKWASGSAAQALLAEVKEDKAPKVGWNSDLEEMIADYLDGMREWYRYYSAKVRPAKKSLRLVIGTLRGRGSVKMQPACIQLEGELDELLADIKAFDSPDKTSGPTLAQAYRHFKKMATHCRHGRAGLVNAELEQAEDLLRTAALELQIYGLKP